MTEEEWEAVYALLRPQPGDEDWNAKPQDNLYAGGRRREHSAVAYFAEALRNAARSNTDPTEFYPLMAAHCVLTGDAMAASEYMQQYELTLGSQGGRPPPDEIQAPYLRGRL